MSKPMTEEYANVVYDALVKHAGAPESRRGEFVYHQTNEFCIEYRFMGSLGFGGKFWRNAGSLRDGSWGEMWYVNNYSEDETVNSVAMVNRTNDALYVLADLFLRREDDDS